MSHNINRYLVISTLNWVIIDMRFYVSTLNCLNRYDVFSES